LSLVTEPSRPHGGRFFVAGGTLNRDAESYVPRAADDELFDAIIAGSFCYVLTPRQMGKSSLMVRTAARLRSDGQTAIVIDLTEIGQNVALDQWYRGLLLALGDETGLDPELRAVWSRHADLGPMQRLVRGITDVLLPARPGRITIFIDEIDAVRSLPFPTGEFFAGIRELYNRRASEPDLERVSFCLLGVASPSDLIRDTRTTPFNIGRRISLDDFTATEAAPLARGLGRADDESRALLARILDWTGGHPYLTQRLCAAIAEDPAATTAGDVDRACDRLFLSRSARERDDNLLFVRDRMLRSESDLAALLDLYRLVRAGKAVADGGSNPLVGILRLAGIVRVADGRLVVRNRIYEQVFDEDWIRASMPDAEVRRQRRAFAAGMVRTAAVALAILAVMVWLVYDARSSRNLAEEHRRVAEHERTLNQRLLYVAHINLAYQALERQDFARIAQIIADEDASPAPPGGRGFEFDYLRRLIRSDRLTVPVGEVVWKVRWTKDDGVVVARCGDGTIRGVDARSGSRLYEIPQHDGGSMDIALSKDGNELVVLGDDSIVRYYDVRTGAPLRSVSTGNVPEGESRLADGGEYVIVTDRRNDVRIRNVANGHTVTTSSSQFGPLGGVVSSPDGRYLLSGHGREGSERLALWSLPGGDLLRSIPVANSQIRDAAWSHDGSRIVTGSVAGDVIVYDAATGASVTRFHTFGIATLTFSRSGKFIAICTMAGTVELWDVANAARISEFIGHTEPAQSVAFSEDDATLVSGGPDRTMKFWDARSVTSGSDVLAGHTDAVYSVAFNRDGSLLASASFDGTVRLWNPETNQPVGVLRGHRGFVRSVAFSPDGRFLASSGDDETVRIWDVAQQQQVRELDGHGERVFCVDWSPDGSTLASASFDRTVRLWDPASGACLRILGTPNASIECVAFSPDGATVAAGGESRTVRIWVVATGALVGELEGHSDWVNSLAYAPSGSKIATVGSFSDVTVRVWDLETRKTEFVFKGFGGFSGITPRSVVTGTGRANCARFSPDGLRLVLGTTDRTVKLFDVVSGQEMCTLATGHQSQIYSVAFSADGKIMATGSEDGTVRLFRAM